MRIVTMTFMDKAHEESVLKSLQGKQTKTKPDGQKSNWICLPVKLIGAVFKHTKLTRAKGTVFAPIWQSTYIWLLCYPNGKSLAYFVKSHLVVSPRYKSIGNNTVFVGQTSFKSLVLKMWFHIKQFATKRSQFFEICFKQCYLMYAHT